jgi:hypothetical protein
MAEKRNAGKPAFGHWRELETAPRDGGEFLAAYHGGKVVVTRFDPAWEIATFYLTPPTHWMPLPQPPVQREP